MTSASATTTSQSCLPSSQSWAVRAVNRGRSSQAVRQPRMNFGHAILQQRQVPVLGEQPGLDAGNVGGQPFAVTEGHEHVLHAMQEQDRDGDVGYVESPRQDQA